MWRRDQNWFGERRLLSDGCYSHDDGDLHDCSLHHLAAAHYDHTFFWQPAKDTHLADACV
jgi:hypothetical protein